MYSNTSALTDGSRLYTTGNNFTTSQTYTFNKRSNYYTGTSRPQGSTTQFNIHANTKVDYESALALAERLFNHYCPTGQRITAKDALRIINDARSIANPSKDLEQEEDLAKGEDFVQHHDRDIDGALTKKDFVEAIVQYLCGPGGSGVNLAGKVDARAQLIEFLHGAVGEDEVEMELKKARVIFERYDLNRDGFLDRNEVRNMMRDTYENLRTDVRMTDDAVDKYFSMIETEKEELISQEEYEIFVLGALKSRNISD